MISTKTKCMMGWSFIAILMVMGLWVYPAPVLGQESTTTYTIYFSSDCQGYGLYATNTNGEYLKKLTQLNYANVLTLMCLSADYTKIAYQGFLSGGADWNVFLVDTASSVEMNLTTASGASSAASESPKFFSPSGWLYFASERSNYNGWPHAYRMRENGSSAQSVSPTYAMWEPATMSPDYAYLLLENADNWNLHSRLYVANADGSNRRLIYDSPGSFGRMRGSAWLPIVDKIVFSGGTHDGDHSLFIINPDGSGLNTLGFSGANNWPFGQYRWGMFLKIYTSDGQKIVFSANPTGNYDIYMQNIDGSGLTRLTTSAAHDKNPIITPDDQQLLWISENDGTRSLWIMDINGSNKRKIREDLGNVEYFIIGEPEPNRPPVARCVDIDKTVEEGCQTTITAEDIDGGSSDPDEDAIELSLDNSGPFSIGQHVVNLTVTDEHGKSATCQATVTVLDGSPPRIDQISASPAVLWPPNHKMVPVTLQATATDNCDTHPECTILQVTSNEPINGLGDGDTAPDWEITGELTVNLRAERSGKGTGRVYTITLLCVDDSGNQSTGTIQVLVPHKNN